MNWIINYHGFLSFLKTLKIQSRFIILCIQLISVISAFSQSSDSIKPISHFSGYIQLTNKGISTIPNLTLGKPAVIFYLSGGKNLRFEPEFRVGLNGKPWMFIFWWRYDLINTEKFFIKPRINAGVLFNTIKDTANILKNNTMGASRTLTGDLIANYLISKHVSLGLYYLYTYGLEKTSVKNTNLLGLRTSFSNIMLNDQFYLGFNPMLYFLQIDKNHGYYANATLSLAKKNFPLSISALINKTIQTGIPLGENFLWNVSLVYTFSKNYVEK